MARAGLAIAEEIEHHQWIVLAHGVLSGVYVELLAFAAARGQIERARALAQAIRSDYLVHATTMQLALICLAQGELAQAAAHFATMPEQGGTAQLTLQRMIQRGRAELALASGEPTLALDLVEGLIATAVNLTAEGVIPALWLLRGQALAALGHPAEAEAVLRSVEVAAQQRGLRPLLRRIHLALGTVYQAQARRAEAEGAFTTARVITEELAAGVPDEPVPGRSGESLRAQFLRAATAPIPPPRPLTARQATKRDSGGLTARESQVAALIAQGLSNRAIAAALVVSERTVTTHITSVLTKLGFASRAQIAAWVVEHGQGKAEAR